MSKKIYLITNSFAVPISSFFLFYFSIAGAFIFPIDAYFGFQGEKYGLHYYIIFKKLFNVNFDNDYFLSVLFYSIFNFSFLYGIYYLLKLNWFKLNNRTESETKIRINPYRIFLISLILILISMTTMWPEISKAIIDCKSIYTFTRFNTNPLYTVHQICNEFAVIIPFIAYSFHIQNDKHSNLSISKDKKTFILILLSCSISSIYLSILGNRREVLSALVICTLFMLQNFKHNNIKKYFSLLSLILLLFFSSEILRTSATTKFLHKIFIPNVPIVSNNSDDFMSSDQYSGGSKLKRIVSSFVLSNELFYAQFSMYGAVHQSIKPTYGSSINYLMHSVIPKFISNNRPDDIYTYYVKQVHAAKGQGYTLNHATGWYLNFGIWGLFIGAFILSAILVSCFYFFLLKHTFSNVNLVIASNLILALVSAQFIILINAGPEGLKSLVVEGILIPVILIRIASTKIPTTLKSVAS